jgi:hypothetical protein
MHKELLIKIDAFLSLKHGAGERMCEWTFGHRAACNGRLVERLRAGGDVRTKTARRVVDYIDAETARLATTLQSHDGEQASSRNSEEIAG